MDDNNRKPLCRLHFNAKQKYFGLIDANKKEMRYPIEDVDDLFSFSEELLNSVAIYE